MKTKKICVKLTTVTLCIASIAGACACGTDNEPTSENVRFRNTATLAYVPLDDRPVNVDRVQALAESLDYTLAMPDADLYSTHLDNQTKNSNGTQYGDRNAILTWLQNTPADCYLLSLDQLLSGGLVNSRVMREDSLEASFAIVDQVLELIGEKPAVVFDSVMRLASTVGYNGYGMDVYDALRAYGSVARAPLSGEALTVENITAGYPFDAEGKEIATNLDESVISDYFRSRERKLRLSEYYLTRVREKANVYNYFGIDDSSPQTTIQTNEVALLRGLCAHGTVFSGLDELGLTGVTKLYRSNLKNELSAQVVYYGGGEDEAGDDYDTGTLKENVDGHLATLGVTQGENAQLKIMILTKPGKDAGTAYAAARDTMIEEIRTAQNAQTPLIVIDASTPAHYGMLQYSLVRKTKLGLILGYSNWNTSSNTVGIALANGIGRYAYLRYGETTERGHDGFLKTLAISYVKDICYKISKMPLIENQLVTAGYDTSNFYAQVTDWDAFYAEPLKTLTENSDARGVKSVLDRLNATEIIVSLDGYAAAQHKTVSVSEFEFPWYRTFELRFTVALS
ncbi:MAG: DUF4127 family protein [Clostridia bacterium]|nr:DUF4127 family protein [Clostridia bacterium]